MTQTTTTTTLSTTKSTPTRGKEFLMNIKAKWCQWKTKSRCKNSRLWIPLEKCTLMTAPEIASFVLTVFLYLESTRCTAAIAHRCLLVDAAANALRKAYMWALGALCTRINWITASTHVDSVVAFCALGVNLDTTRRLCATRTSMHNRQARSRLFSPTRASVRAVRAYKPPTWSHDEL